MWSTFHQTIWQIILQRCTMVLSWFSDIKFSDNLCFSVLSIYLIKSLHFVTLCNLVTVFAETKSVTKLRWHCIYFFIGLEKVSSSLINIFESFFNPFDFIISWLHFGRISAIWRNFESLYVRVRHIFLAFKVSRYIEGYSFVSIWGP